MKLSTYAKKMILMLTVLFFVLAFFSFLMAIWYPADYAHLDAFGKPLMKTNESFVQSGFLFVISGGALIFLRAVISEFESF